MNQVQLQKYLATVPTAAVGSTATSTLTIDRLGYDNVSVSAIRASNASTVFANVLKIEESHDNSTYVDVTAFVGGGTGGFSIPAVSDTSNASIIQMDVDCRARRRYLKVSMTPGATATLAIVAALGKGETPATTASGAGLIARVVG
jgi:hypothetical protein